MSSLDRLSDDFARNVQRTLDGVLPGQRRVVSERSELESRCALRVAGEDGAHALVPLLIQGRRQADLEISFLLQLDSSGAYLKVARSHFRLLSVLSRIPLARLEYRADSYRAPISHWQIHAERGAFSHILAHAHSHRPSIVTDPHDLSSLHFPLGGERFRPGLEDFLEFLVRECGVDSVDGWQSVLAAGREQWRGLQLASAVRDRQHIAAEALVESGWTVTPPASGVDRRSGETFISW